jgi:hypothetical protein
VRAARLHRRRVLPARARFDPDVLGGARPYSVKFRRLDAAFEDDIASNIVMNARRAFSRSISRRYAGVVWM